MWHVTAEEDLRCTECSHEIAAGAVCLSQMPPEMPEKFRRNKYENFCVDCSECSAKNERRTCYARRLNHWYTHTERTPEAVECAFCGKAVPENVTTIAQKFYAWPELEPESGSVSDQSDGEGVSHGAGAAGIAAAGTVKSGAGGWHNLSPGMQRVFQRRGLGGSRGIRSQAMAQRLYESIPKSVRSSGEGAVRDFLKGKNASHIRSVSNAPGQAKWPSNIVWEDAGKNAARGSGNMTAAEVAAAKSASRASAIKIGAKSAFKSGAKAGAVASAIEATVSVPENILHWKRGRKSGEQAAKDTVKSTATAAGVGVATVGVAKGVAMAGVGLSLGPLGTPLIVASGVLLVGTSAHRLIKAAKHDLPLDEHVLFFCKNKRRCKTRFASDITNAVRDVGAAIPFGS